MMRRIPPRQHNFIPIFCLLLSALFSPDARAEEEGLVTRENNSSESIDTVIVTGTRTEKPFLTSPYSANRLSDDTIGGERQARSLPDALQESAGVAVQKTAPGQGSPYVRGWTGFRNVLLLDGVRINNSTFREGPNEYWNTIDPYALSRMELVRGPNAVMYGSDAIGGTLQTFLRGPADYADSGAFFGRGLVRGASAESSAQGHLEAGARSGDMALLLGGSFKHFGPIQAAEPVGLQQGVSYEQYDVLAKGTYQPSEHHEFILAISSNKLDNNPRTHVTQDAISWEGTTVGTDIYRRKDVYRDLAYVQYIGRAGDATQESIHFCLSFARQSEEEIRKRNNFRISNAGYTVLTPGAFLQINSALMDLGNGHTGRWTMGGDYYADSVNSFYREHNTNGTVREIGLQGPVGDDALYQMLGVYLQYDHWLNERYNAIAGVRYTHVNTRVGRYDTNPLAGPANQTAASLQDSWSDLSASLRFLMLIDPNNSAFVGATQGFRAPNLSDLTRLEDFGTTGFEIPSPGLDPEHFISFEIGLKHRSPRVVAQVSYFYTYIDSLIIRVPSGSAGPLTLFAKRNSSYGFVHGVEIEAKTSLGGLQAALENVWLFGNATWQEGQVEGYNAANQRTTETLGKMPPAMALFGVRWEHPRQKYFAETLVRWADLQDRLSTADKLDISRIPPGGTPAYMVLAVRGGARLDVAGTPVRISAAVENLTDQDYRVHGSGSNEPGINAIGTIEIQY